MLQVSVDGGGPHGRGGQGPAEPGLHPIGDGKPSKDWKQKRHLHLRLILPGTGSVMGTWAGEERVRCPAAGGMSQGGGQHPRQPDFHLQYSGIFSPRCLWKGSGTDTTNSWGTQADQGWKGKKFWTAFGKTQRTQLERSWGGNSGMDLKDEKRAYVLPFTDTDPENVLG